MQIIAVREPYLLLPVFVNSDQSYHQAKALAKFRPKSQRKD
jgi:hypothetical protein